MSKNLFKKGNKLGNRFKKGYKPWNKGKKGYTNAGSFKDVAGKKHPMWGKKHTEEAKNKMSRAKKDKYVGDKNPSWRGGITKHNGKYLMIKKPNHPSAGRHGYVYWHRLVVEQDIGRYLTKDERVHHLDGDINNNNVDNLILCANNSGHLRLHQNMQEFMFKLMRDKKVSYDKDKNQFYLT